MYVCNDCGAVIEEPDATTEEVSDGYRETYLCCPYCGGNDIEKARQCVVCEDWYAGDDELCPACAESAKRRFRRIIKGQFTPDEVNLIDHELDGVYIADYVQKDGD